MTRARDLAVAANDVSKTSKAAVLRIKGDSAADIRDASAELKKAKCEASAAARAETRRDSHEARRGRQGARRGGHGPQVQPLEHCRARQDAGQEGPAGS